MKCENNFCIYENNGVCLLNHIELDIQGQCKECIYVNVEDDELEIMKEKSRLNLGF